MGADNQQESPKRRIDASRSILRVALGVLIGSISLLLLFGFCLRVLNLTFNASVQVVAFAMLLMVMAIKLIHGLKGNVSFFSESSETIRQAPDKQVKI